MTYSTKPLHGSGVNGEKVRQLSTRMRHSPVALATAASAKTCRSIDLKLAGSEPPKLTMAYRRKPGIAPVATRLADQAMEMRMSGRPVAVTKVCMITPTKRQMFRQKMAFASKKGG